MVQREINIVKEVEYKASIGENMPLSNGKIYSKDKEQARWKE